MDKPEGVLTSDAATNRERECDYLNHCSLSKVTVVVEAFRVRVRHNELANPISHSFVHSQFALGISCFEHTARVDHGLVADAV